eukprot:jgi/Astpho2/5977/Aster-03938
MQGNQPMSGQTLNVHLRQAFDLAGVPCGRLDGYSTKGEVSHKFKKHGVEAAKNVGINKAEIKMAARHESDTTDLYCIQTQPTGWLGGDGTGRRTIVWVWKISDFQTVPEAFEAFSKISAVPSDLRRWHGSK